ncbi:hypothetical protein ACLKA7_004607 [Drosophila subpalustris]
MFTVDQCCCCFTLKWGTLAIAIFRILHSLVEICFALFESRISGWKLYLSAALRAIHFIVCILLIVSIWVKKSLLVIGYLIFDVILMIALLGFSIYNFCSGEILYGVVCILFIFLFIYFWICVFSWFMELRKLEKEN